MTEQEWCAQHPETCDEDGFYLYQDKPWEDMVEPYEPDDWPPQDHTQEQIDFIHLYTKLLSEKLERDFNDLTWQERDEWMKSHQAELDALKAEHGAIEAASDAIPF